jgi:hypothetical protein
MKNLARRLFPIAFIFAALAGCTESTSDNDCDNANANVNGGSTQPQSSASHEERIMLAELPNAPSWTVIDAAGTLVASTPTTLATYGLNLPEGAHILRAGAYVNTYAPCWEQDGITVSLARSYPMGGDPDVWSASDPITDGNAKMVPHPIEIEVKKDVARDYERWTLQVNSGGGTCGAVLRGAYVDAIVPGT